MNSEPFVRQYAFLLLMSEQRTVHEVMAKVFQGTAATTARPALVDGSEISA
jgi:hypothetical protein